MTSLTAKEQTKFLEMKWNMLPLASTYEVDIAVKHGHISNMFMTILRVLKGGSYLNFLSTDFN